MKVLLIGGTGLTGPSAAAYLQQAGHEVTIFHRGKTAAPAGSQEIIGEQSQMPEFRREFERRKFDVVVDFIKKKLPASVATQLEAVLASKGNVGTAADMLGGLLGGKK